MNKSIILATFTTCFVFSKVSAQTVNGIRLSEIRADYIEITAITPLFSEKRYISMEYGQNAADLTNTYIKDDQGKKLEFNSALDCISKMKNYGYELFEAYAVRNSKGSSQKYYILKRK